MSGRASWPVTEAGLVAVQRELAGADPPPWRPESLDELFVGGCFVCFPRGRPGVGSAGDPAWAAAVVLRGRRVEARCTASGTAGAPYQPGLLALREGPLLDAAVRGLPRKPDVLLVNATGRDHPRRAGLALHLGAALDIPTIGVTHRPLLAEGDWPADAAGAASPLRLDGDVVGVWLRTRPGRRPLAVQAGWRTDPDTAAEVVRHGGGRRRTPAPLREARRLARTARGRPIPSWPLSSSPPGR